MSNQIPDAVIEAVDSSHSLTQVDSSECTSDFECTTCGRHAYYNLLFGSAWGPATAKACSS